MSSRGSPGRGTAGQGARGREMTIQVSSPRPWPSDVATDSPSPLATPSAGALGSPVTPLSERKWITEPAGAATGALTPIGLFEVVHQGSTQ